MSEEIMTSGSNKSQDNYTMEDLKAKVEELSELLKSKDKEIISKDSELELKQNKIDDLTKEVESNKKEIEELKTELNKCENQEEFPYFKLDNDNLPTDIISLWINNPGLSHLARMILSHLDVNSQAKAKGVSKTFYKFLQTDKEFAMLKIFEHKNMKKKYFDDKTYQYSNCSSYEVYYTNRDLENEILNNKKLMIEKFLELLQHENTEVQWKSYYKIVSSGWLSISNSFCIEVDAAKTFLKLEQHYPSDKRNIVNLLYFPKSLTMFIVILDYVINYLKNNEMEDMGMIGFLMILLKFYEEYAENCNIFNEKRLELFFKHSRVLGIDINNINVDGRSILELATLNGHSDIVDLCKKYLN